HIYNLTFGLGCAMVGVMGCLIAPFIPITPSVGLAFGIKSFIVVVLGGIGSIAGSLVGGIVIGVFESVAAQFGTTPAAAIFSLRSEEHTSELQSRENLVSRLLLE